MYVCVCVCVCLPACLPACLPVCMYVYMYVYVYVYVCIYIYPSIPHKAGLKALKEALDKRENRNTATNDLIRTAEFVLKNNYFEFNGQVQPQISGTAIGTKFAPTYACIFMDDVESKFLETRSLQPLIWFRYIDDVFFIWTHREEKLQLFLTHLNNYNPHVKFKYEFNKEHIIPGFKG